MGSVLVPRKVGIEESRGIDRHDIRLSTSLNVQGLARRQERQCGLRRLPGPCVAQHALAEML